jgi:hypothetical protein
MSLSYYFTITAPATTTADQLAAFLSSVEKEAQRMGFRPTLVLDGAFDTAERREFAKQLTKGLTLEDERLKGVTVPADADVWRHDPDEGICRLLPTRGVVLVVTDERGCETVFGFCRYAEAVKDIHGRTLAETGLEGRWYFSNFVDNPDLRFREIVQLFAGSGYVASEEDEFRPTTRV